MSDYQYSIDLAGEIYFNPNFWQTKTRIDCLIDKYLNPERLRDYAPHTVRGDRLEDVPEQFNNSHQPRQWQAINWHEINLEQIIGIDLEIFLSVIKGAIATEVPICGCTPTSKKYIYQQLTAAKITSSLRTVKSYPILDRPSEDLYSHGLHCVIIEYSAVCLYLWLMAHTTGTIQQILAELLQDEVDRMTEFWEVGMWLYPDTNPQLIHYVLSQLVELLQPLPQQNLSSGSPISTFSRMMSVLNWQSWSSLCKIELIYTFTEILMRMGQWSSSPTPEDLQPFRASPQFFEV